MRFCILVAFLLTLPLRADPILGPWTPIFKGIDFSVSTNISNSTNFPHLQVVSALRVDLNDPDIRLLTTRRNTNYIANVREVGALTVSDFVDRTGVQAAINANFFSVGQYYLPPDYPMDVYGLAISEGVVVSDQRNSSYSTAIMFDQQNRPTVVHTNWPALGTDGVWTAVAGNRPLVVNGTNIARRTGNLDSDPRTAFGISQDQRFLFLIAIDGRQDGYSDGAYDFETAGWMILLGAYNAINVDGGGSTTLVMQDSTGAPIRLNRSSAVADSGRERTVGSHFGIFAKPLPGFINDITAVPDETTARITWTTVAPATSQVEYGPTEDLGSLSDLATEVTTDHAVQLIGLAKGVGYYFRVLSETQDADYSSQNFYFMTTNHVSTNELFGITNYWKFSAANLDGINWAASDYDDSSWSGPGPGLLWVDTRSTPNPLVEPKNTQMPHDAGTGFPYFTYYFRTHFSLTNVVSGTSLKFSIYVDDGAVFYLNGAEIWRLRVPVGAGSATLADGFGCSGDATCLEEIIIPPNAVTNLVNGDNVLAVEVHNYNARSADITFGAGLSLLVPATTTTQLTIQHTGGSVSISWEGDGFILQQATDFSGPWTDVPGGEQSPFAITPSEAYRFYRVRR